MRTTYPPAPQEGRNRTNSGTASNANLPMRHSSIKELLARVMRLARLVRFYESPTSGPGAWDASLRLDPVLALADFFDRYSATEQDYAAIPGPGSPEQDDGDGKTASKRIFESVKKELETQEYWLETLNKAGVCLALPPCPFPSLPDEDAETFRRLCRGAAIQTRLRRSLLREQAETAFENLLEHPEGGLQAHTGLLLAFLRQYRGLTRKVDGLGALFTRYFYEQRLGLTPAPAEPDHAVVVALPPAGTPAFTLEKGARFATADPLLQYRATESVTVSPARVGRALALLPAGTPGPFLMQNAWENFAEENGQGAWQPFHAESEHHFHACPTVLSLPSLYLEGGDREVDLVITLAALPETSGKDQNGSADALSSVEALLRAWNDEEGTFERQPLFQVAVSTAEGWLQPDGTRLSLVCAERGEERQEPSGVEQSPDQQAEAPESRDGTVPESRSALSEGDEGIEDQPCGTQQPASSEPGPHLRIRLRIPDSAPALAPPVAKIHGLAARHPSLRLMPQTLESAVWEPLSRFRPARLHISYTIMGVRHAQVIAGGMPVPVGDDEPFAAFGPAPVSGSCVELHIPELRSKKTRALYLDWEWSAPDNFSEYFAAYPFQTITLRPEFRFSDTSPWRSAGGTVELPGGTLNSLDFPITQVPRGTTGFRWMLRSSGSLFGHAGYPSLLSRATLNESGMVRKCWAWMRGDVLLSKLNPPYTPLWSAPRVNYTAEAIHDLAAEPGILRHCPVLPELLDEARPPVSIFAHYSETLLALRLEDVPDAPEFPLSLYLRLQHVPLGNETAVQELPNVSRVLHARIIRDETCGFMESGLIQVQVTPPCEIVSPDSAVLPSLVWMVFCLSEPHGLTVRGVHAQAVPVEQVMGAETPKPERPYPLPSGSITGAIPLPYDAFSAEEGTFYRDWKEDRRQTYSGLLESLAVTQPYPSEGGRPSGDGSAGREAFYAECAERLLHREQAVLPRDYETLLLRHFPEAVSARCLSHTDGQGNSAPGAVRVAVLAPPVGARLYVGAEGGGETVFRLDPCRPCYADGGLLSRMEGFLSRRAGLSVSVHVAQPTFIPLRIRLHVRLTDGKAHDEARDALQGAVVSVAAPWAENPCAAVLGACLCAQPLLGAVHGVKGIVRVEELAVSISQQEENTPLFFAANGVEFPEAALRPDAADGLFYVDTCEVSFAETIHSSVLTVPAGGRHEF